MLATGKISTAGATTTLTDFQLPVRELFAY
jgi:hypothetical protein